MFEPKKHLVHKKADTASIDQHSDLGLNLMLLDLYGTYYFDEYTPEEQEVQYWLKAHNIAFKLGQTNRHYISIII